MPGRSWVVGVLLVAACSAEQAQDVSFPVVPDAPMARAPDAAVEPDARMVGVTCAYAGSAGPAPATLRPPAEDLPLGSVCDDDGFCWLNPLPSGTWWTAIAAAGSDDVWIGGESPRVLHFDGARWKEVATPLTVVSAIWAAAEDDVWLVGDGANDTVGIAHWDGVSMTQPEDPDWAPEGVWGSAADDVYAVSIFGIQHWDGTGWSELTRYEPQTATPLGPIVAGTSSSDVWVVGGLASWRGAGSTWSRVAELDSRHVWGIAALSPADVWVGSTAEGFWQVDHFDGRTWTTSLGRPFDFEPRSLVAGGRDDIWAVGWGPGIAEGGLLHYDGGCWTVLPQPPGWVDLVRSLGARGDFAVGHGGEILQLHPGIAPGWTDLRVGSTAALTGVWASSATDAWAVGEGGVTLHLDGATMTPVPSGVSAYLTDVFGTGRDDVWAVGAGGTVLHFDGTSWSSVPSGVSSDLQAVFTARPGDVWVAGDDGVLLHLADGVFTAVQPPGATGETYFVDLHGLAPDDVWLVSSQTVWHFDGATWSTARRTDAYFRRVWEVAPNDVWLTDYGDFRGNTEYQHYDGSTWTETYAPPSPATWMFPRPGHAHASFAVDASTLFVVGPGSAWERKIISPAP